MDRTSWANGLKLLALLAIAGAAGVSAAQTQVRKAYNPVTKRTQPVQVGTPANPVVEPADLIEDVPVEIQQAQMLAPCDCGDGGCYGCAAPTIDCGEGCGPGGMVARQGGCFAGFEFTIVKPRFESNVAFTTTESDGVGNDVISDTEFDYDLELTPRVFIGWSRPGGVGLRVTYWQFDNAPNAASTNPPGNGFGAIDHPTFGTVDIGSTVPTDTFSASTHLNAYTIDVEATHEVSFGCWDLGVGTGLRYASSDQGYRASLVNNTNVLRGQINYNQSIEGVGPTVALRLSRPLSARGSLFANARASVLYGDGESRLDAGEDLDLTAPFTTVRTTTRDDLLSIGEVQLGLQWKGGGHYPGSPRPFITFALEGQVWDGAGSASSEEGMMGFFGFASQVGLDW